MTTEVIKHEYKLTKEKALKILNIKGDVKSMQVYTPQEPSTGRSIYEKQFISIHTEEEVEV